MAEGDKCNASERDMSERPYEPGLSELDYYDILTLAYDAKARAQEPQQREKKKR